MQIKYEPFANTRVKQATDLYPQGTSFADRSQLGGLKVRETERWEITILPRKGRKAIDDHNQFRQNQSQSFLEEDEIRVASRRSG